MRSSIILASSLLLAACGDDASSNDAGPEGPDGGGEGCTCLALGADYEAGVGLVSRVSLPSLTVETDLAPGAISSDPVARLFGWEMFVVNRFGADNITIFDGVSNQVVDQFSTGEGSNPQDVALVGDKIYVAAFNAPSLLIYDRADTSKPSGMIDLSSYDPDGLPNPAAIAVVGERAFVILTLLDDTTFAPRGDGLVVVVDLTDDTVETTFELQNPNPVGFLRAHGDLLAVVTAGDYSGTTGCLETIDPVALTASCIVENQLVNGVLNAFASVDDETLYATVVGVTPGEGRLWRVTDVEGSALTPTTQEVTDVAHCPATNQLLYNDRATGGLRVWDIATNNEVTTQPLDLGLPAAFGNAIVCW